MLGLFLAAALVTAVAALPAFALGSRRARMLWRTVRTPKTPGTPRTPVQSSKRALRAGDRAAEAIDPPMAQTIPRPPPQPPR